MAAPTSIQELKAIPAASGPRTWVSDAYYTTVVGKSGSATAEENYDLRWLHGRPRNLVVNGTFWRWPDGAGPFGYEQYGPDLWYLAVINADDASVERVTVSPGSFAGAPQYGARVTIQSVFEAPGVWSPGSVRLCQRIEDVRTAAGMPLVFGARLRAGSSSTWTAVRPYVRQVFGSGGSATVTTVSPDTGGTAQDDQSWNGRVNGLVNVPSISGKTIGANSYLEVGLEFEQLTYDQDEPSMVDVTEVQIHPGHVILPALPVDYAAEEAICERFYQRTAIGQYRVVTSSPWAKLSSTQAFWVYPFRRPLRVAPTLTLPVASRWHLPVAAGSYTPTLVATYSAPTTTHVEMYANVSTTAGEPRHVSLNTADAIIADARFW